MAVQVKDSKETRNIAAVSASSNQEIGEKIGVCFDKVGKTGVVSIEEGKGTETSIEIVEGMQFDKGYASAYFCTNGERMLVEMNNPYLLITDKKITSAQEILPILQHIAASGQELLIIADDIDGDAPLYAGHKQTARHFESRGCQSARLRRQAESDARRYRGPHRRPSRQRRQRDAAPGCRSGRSRERQAKSSSAKIRRRSSTAKGAP